MKTLNTVKVTAVSLLMTACSYAPKKQHVLHETIPPAAISRTITTLAEESRNAIDKTYKIFGRDTICIGNSEKLDKTKAANKILNYAQNASIIKKYGYKYTSSCNCYEELKHYIFKKAKAVIKSDKVFADNRENLYVPVEYYGKN